ncbi:MAG: aminotransferase class I/II-fold pyridoxal phosphate-dependent enzyme [Caldilineaceae bacterium]
MSNWQGRRRHGEGASSARGARHRRSLRSAAAALDVRSQHEQSLRRRRRPGVAGRFRSRNGCASAAPFLFSSAMTVPGCGGGIEATAMLQESEERVQRLWSNAAFFKDAMQKMGFDIGHSQTPIVPVMLGEAPLAQQFSRRLFEEGVFAGAIGFPTVPQGKARIRVMNSAAHSKGDLEEGLAAFEKIGRELGVIYD